MGEMAPRRYDLRSQATKSPWKTPRAWPMGETGLEPATSAMSKQCSNQLSYPPGKTHYTERARI